MTGYHTMSEEVIRLREEITEQYRALAQMKEMAAKYGYDISKPAANAKEAVQWLYFGYLAAIKSQMVLRCQSDVSQHSLISISNVIWIME